MFQTYLVPRDLQSLFYTICFSKNMFHTKKKKNGFIQLSIFQVYSLFTTAVGLSPRPFGVFVVTKCNEGGFFIRLCAKTSNLLHCSSLNALGSFSLWCWHLDREAFISTSMACSDLKTDISKQSQGEKCEVWLCELVVFTRAVAVFSIKWTIWDSQREKGPQTIE